MDETITALRAELFAALRGLKSGTLDIDRAKAINEVSQTIINSAKVEVEHMKVTGEAGTGFIASELSDKPGLANGQKAIELPNGVRVIQHRIKG